MSFTDTEAAWIVAAVLAGQIVPQFGLAVWFIRMIRGCARLHADGTDGREAAATVPSEVVLCLRGCDATLHEVFASLARQRHRDWRLRVIVDSERDPAWEVAHAAVRTLEADGASWREATIEPLATRPTTGSLKCASLRQAFATLDPAARVVALIDADSVVREEWLITLVDGCMRPGVGAVSGNRWYDPVHDTLTGTVRMLWNAGAIVQMAAFGIPWGGSLAVRREALDACAWPDVIRTTLCEDTALAAPLALAGWKYQFVPALLAVDRDDDVALVPLTRWIARQLLTARLHHRSWPLVALHGVGTSVAIAVAIAWCGVAMMRGSWTAVAIVATAVVAYEAVTAALFLAIESAIEKAVVAAGGHLRRVSLGRVLWRFAMIPMTQAVYATATLIAITTRSIEWRGVIYDVVRIGGRTEVHIRGALSEADHDTARAGDGAAE
jgi:hypothetical protein